MSRFHLSKLFHIWVAAGRTTGKAVGAGAVAGSALKSLLSSVCSSQFLQLADSSGSEMGRGKIEIKRIENSTNRQVTFTKRKNGIIKKAKEISVLCNAQVYVLLFSSSGKMAEFCSDNSSLSRMLEQYHKYTGNRIWEAKHERLNAEIDRIKKENDSMQIELRRLKGEDIAPLSPYELIPLEATLQRGLDCARAKQMDFLKKLKKNERLLDAENKELGMILEEHEASRGLHHHHHHQQQQQQHRHHHHHHHHHESSYSFQTPFSFCGQPIRRSLEDGK